MAIQLRKGLASDLDKSKLLPGEIAVPTTGRPQLCRKTNDVIGLLTTDDAPTMDALIARMIQLETDLQNMIAQKVGINDSAASTTQAYSSSKTTALVDELNNNLIAKPSTEGVRGQVLLKDYANQNNNAWGFASGASNGTAQSSGGVSAGKFIKIVSIDLTALWSERSFTLRYMDWGYGDSGVSCGNLIFRAKINAAFSGYKVALYINDQIGFRNVSSKSFYVCAYTNPEGTGLRFDIYFKYTKSYQAMSYFLMDAIGGIPRLYTSVYDPQNIVSALPTDATTYNCISHYADPVGEHDIWATVPLYANYGLYRIYIPLLNAVLVDTVLINKVSAKYGDAEVDLTSNFTYAGEKNRDGIFLRTTNSNLAGRLCSFYFTINA